MTRGALPVFFAAAAGASGACGRRPSPPPPAPPAAVEHPAPAQAPANVSHGEAPVGAPETVAPVNPDAPPRSRLPVHRIRLEIRHATVTLAEGTKYDAWTFGGAIPGPVLRVTEGDTVDFTLINRAPIPHSMDFHAAEIAPSRYYTNILPGDSIHYRFVPRVVGAFMYHCGTAPVAAHIANGMYGALIVDPRTPRPPAREFVLVQSEFYFSPTLSAAGAHSLDWDKLLSLAPDHVVFNGRAAQYATAPIAVKTGELLRIYLVNAGPNRVSAFHVVGAIFERVFEDAGSRATMEGVQTVGVPMGGGAIFEVRLKEPGNYPFVSHAFADATKGAVGIFMAAKPAT